MNITSKLTGNELTITASATETDLAPVVKSTYNRLRPSVKADGFRPGKAPNNVIERELGIERVQAEVLDALAEKLYRHALDTEDFRPINNPQANVKKFVPYTEAEIDFVVEVMPEIKLSDYKKTIKAEKPATVDDAEIEKVIESLRDRLAERIEVKRAAKLGDEAVIDFKGIQAGKPVAGAEAKDYPLLLGSDRFIPGFEAEIVGLKLGDDKTFTITFPKDYGESSLAGGVVEFTVKLKKITKLQKPVVDDEFAKSAGPFADLKALRKDIHDHLQSEKAQAAAKAYESKVIKHLTDKAQVTLPPSMIEQEQQRVQADFNRRLEEQGSNLDSYLKAQKRSLADHEAEVLKEAEGRVKTSLLLSEIAKLENIEVSPEELEVRLQVIAGQYQDQKIQSEIMKPEIRREIANQLLAEKTVAKLVEYASKS